MWKRGYYHLVHYARQKTSEWNPESNLSNPELRNLMEMEEESEYTIRFRNIIEQFSLTQAEEYFVFLSVLQECSQEILGIYNLYTNQNIGLNIELAYDIYKKNYGKQAKIRWELLFQFLFEERNEINSLRLKSYVVQYIKGNLGSWEEPTLQEVDSNENFELLKNISGQFYFSGTDSLEKTNCFLALSQYKEKKAYLIHCDSYVSMKAFLAVVEKGSLCVTSESFLELVRKYLQYLSFFVLLGEQKHGNHGFFEVAFQELNFEERHLVWKKISKKYHVDFDCRLIANQYSFTKTEMIELWKHADLMRKIDQKDQISLEYLMDAIHQKLLARGTNPRRFDQVTYRMDQVVLPTKQKEKIKEAMGQVQNKHKVLETFGIGEMMHYGTGLSVLFVGPPGTGKTMCAYAFANELKAVIYKIDLSAIVSKFIGETEKNLKQVFEEAKKTQAILFFDEADVLFSKRTEVKDSADKYSNMEAAFLLQEIEHYDGITLLATNFLQNIDESFKRRMKFVVEFPFPSKEERLLIFQKALPEKLPISSDVDFEFLAENFELSGGNIRNIIYNAAFLAANKDDILDMTCLMKSVITEYEKMGKVLGKKDFGIYHSLLEGEG